MAETGNIDSRIEKFISIYGDLSSKLKVSYIDPVSYTHLDVYKRQDEDNMYYIIALLMAYLYHQNANSAADSEGFSAEDIKEAAIGVGINQVAVQKTQVINGLMQELLELNILRHTVNEKYLFSRYSFFQMMGTSDEIDSRLLEYMENQ